MQDIRWYIMAHIVNNNYFGLACTAKLGPMMTSIVMRKKFERIFIIPSIEIYILFVSNFKWSYVLLEFH